MECEILSTCIFFNDNMSDMPATAEMMKRKYCRGNKLECARYMVVKALGKEKVPSNLFPNQVEIAGIVIEADNT
ncbi:MAG: hypothetical protein ABH868_02975 [bacterium]